VWHHIQLQYTVYGTIWLTKQTRIALTPHYCVHLPVCNIICNKPHLKVVQYENEITWHLLYVLWFILNKQRQNLFLETKVMSTEALKAAARTILPFKSWSSRLLYPITSLHSITT
jgi:hypothetical protein